MDSVCKGDAPRDSIPLIVDMDGALLRTDTTFEGLAHGIFARPGSTLLAFTALLGGRAAFKRRIAEIAPIDTDVLPLRTELVDHLVSERRRGRELHLVSGSDDAVVQKVAERLGLFDSAQGSTEKRNLKGSAKAALLDERFGAYAYAGDSPADLKVWKRAQGVVLAGASPSTARRARRLSAPIEAEFLDPPAGWLTWARTLRLHQWSKNILLLVPLFLSGHFRDLATAVACVLGLVLLGLTASGSYILNDLSDLSADRRHRSKRNRPFASGAIKVYQGLLAAPALIAAGLIGAYFLSPAFAGVVVIYLVCTLGYSLRLKEIPFLDVMLLAWLYTLRLLMGVTLAQAEASQWLLSFSMMFFFSLSLAKRYVEISASAADQKEIARRGYVPSDAPLTMAFGVASTVASLLIMTLYLMDEAFPSGVYRNPNALWLVLPVIALWTMRIWLLADRGELDDDPVSFAVRDPPSLWLGAALAATFGFAFFG
jgi:4-hydroxybenzoate polyprenyltransferase